MLDAFANDIQLTLEAGTLMLILYGTVLRSGPTNMADEDVLEARFDGSRGCPYKPIVSRQIAPAEEPLSLFVNDLLDQLFDRGACRRIARKKNCADAVFSFRRKRDPEVFCFLPEEFVRNLNKNPGAVARVDLAAAGAAMEQIDEDLQRLADDGVRADTLDVHDKTHPAGVVFELRIIESLCRWTSRFALHCVVMGYQDP